MVQLDPSSWERLSPLLDELLEADEVQRKILLSRLQLTEPALAQSAAALLAHQEAVRSKNFLEGSLAPPVNDVLAGRVVGDYTIERAIGQGGMGTVWLAQRSDGRYEGRAAVKFLNLAQLGPSGIERFRREGDALAKLAHPNITHLIDAGVADDQPYLVMEYVEGMPIDRWCDTHKLDIAARIRLFLQVLAAISHAHGRLILHRDLKPSNILVTSEGRVKLLDFGLAKLLESEHGSELTRVAGHAFTPEYAAPEQLERAEATTAMDVYALGVLLYVLLAGAHPTAGKSATVTQRMRALAESEPARPSEAVRSIDAESSRARGGSHQQLARALRGDLDTILAHSLRKNPHERYASVDAFAADLQRHLAYEPISARADSRAYRIGKFLRRYRVGVSAAALTALALLGGIAGVAWQARIARLDRDEALYQREIASARSNLMDLVLQAAADEGRPLTQRDILDRSVRLIDKQYRKNPRIAIDLLFPIAGQYAGLGDSDKDIAVMEHAAQLAGASGDPQLIGHVACNTVSAELFRNDLQAAKAQLQKGLSAMARVRNPTLTSILECTRAEAEVAMTESDFDRAIERITDAIERVERLRRTVAPQFTTLLSVLASVHERRGDLPGAFAAYERMSRVQEEAGRADTMNYLSTQGSLARIHILWGEYGEARTIVDAVAPRVRATAGDATAPPWFVRLQGTLLWRFEELQAAYQLLRPAADRLRETGAAANAWRVDVVLTSVLLDMNRLDEAELVLTRAEAEPPGSAYGTIVQATLRARLLLQRAEPVAAAARIEEMLTHIDRSAATETGALATALRTGAQAYAAAGDLAKALDMARAAVNISEKVARHPDRSAEVGEALLVRAQIERAAGLREESIASARRAERALALGIAANHRLTQEAAGLAGAAP